MTKKNSNPYNFPLTTRAKMTSFLLSHLSRHYGYTRYPFVWNVKVYNFDETGKTGDYAVNPALDLAWKNYTGTRDSFFYDVIDEARRNSGLEHSEYTTYPGSDQGDWNFTFVGRSGGWLALKEWRGTDLTKVGHDYLLEEFLEGLSWANLKTFYRGIVTMDTDFTLSAARTNLDVACNFMRYQWEQQFAELTQVPHSEPGFVEPTTNGFTVADLWAKLGDLPVDDNGFLEAPFLHFPTFTDREAVWAWFELTFDVSAAQLMGVA